MAYEPQPGSPLEGAALNDEAWQGERGILVPLNSPTPGIAMFCAGEWEGKVFICPQLYYYGPNAEAATAEVEPKWQAWLDEHFPAVKS